MQYLQVNQAYSIVSLFVRDSRTCSRTLSPKMKYVMESLLDEGDAGGEEEMAVSGGGVVGSIRPLAQSSFSVDCKCICDCSSVNN